MEELTFNRGFEVRTFQTSKERTLFMLREHLITTSVNIWLHADMIQTYMNISQEEKRILGLTHYFTYLSKGKIKLENTSYDGFFVSKIVFVDESGNPIDFEKLNISPQDQVSAILGDNNFSFDDLHLEAKSQVSASQAIHSLLILLQKKYS